MAGTENTTTSIVGTTGDYTTVRNFDVWQGATLNDAAVDAGLHEAVLGATTADDLGLTASSIGSTITIGGLPFRVVGILQAKGSTGPVSQDDQILVPYTTVQDEFVPGDKRPHDRDQRRLGRPDRHGQGRDHDPARDAATTSRSAAPTTSRSPTRPSC